MKISKLTLAAITAIAMTGCATSSLLDSPSAKQTTRATTAKTTLLEDKVVAFGRPAATAGISGSSVVIVGEKHSYVLDDGGVQLVTLLSNLDPKHITVGNQLEFYSANNDGKFTGAMKLSYAKLKDDIKRNDLQFFLQNNAKECTDASDEKMGAQRFCFEINIKGGVYPQVSNYDLVRSQFSPLTRPYSVSIYTNQTTTQTSSGSGKSSAEKLVLLPFALAFDVVTMPLQILGALD